MNWKERFRGLFTGAHAPAGEAKASRAGSLVSMHAPGQPVWTPRNYQALVREGFARNPVGYRCVRMIAEAAASVPWLAYEGRRELNRHPLLDLLARPNPAQSGRSLLEHLYGQLQVTGNAYLEAALIGAEIRELHVLRSDRMRVVPGRTGWPEAFEYSVNGSKVRFVQGADDPVCPVWHMRLFSPIEDHYGMSPIEAAAQAFDVHNAAGAWNKALLDNAARPSGALVFKGIDGSGTLSSDQFDRLKLELRETYQGSANAGRPLVLEGGLEWTPLSLSPKDMEHIEAKHVAAREIALAFGVPPMLLGIPGDNTFSNYAEANRTFWRQTVLPLVARSSEELTAWLSPAFGGDIRLGFDSDAIEALSEDRAALWQRVDAASFLSENEKREAVGYGARPGGDEARPVKMSEFADHD